MLAIRNELRPSDLYCYFTARFGVPNGLHNALRNDNSDNLVHWDWTLKAQGGQVSFWGGNFRTDVLYVGEISIGESFKQELIDQVRADFKTHGKAMSEVRKRLEHWTEYVNPYWRLKRSVEQLQNDLSALDLDSRVGKSFHSPASLKGNAKQWKELASRYDKAFGLCFSLRLMLPVLGEAFVNLLIFILAHKDIRKDSRLYDAVVRQPIDLRIKSLHRNCSGFLFPVDDAHDSFRQYFSLINQRNDLLHGNIVPDKESFNEVYFSGRVPIFEEYRSLWERTIEVDIRATGLTRIHDEIATIELFTSYVISCLEPMTKDLVLTVLEKRHLGRNHEDGRLGVLFPDHLVDVCVDDLGEKRSGSSPARRKKAKPNQMH